MSNKKPVFLKGLIIEWEDSDMRGDLNKISLKGISHNNPMVRFKAKEIFTKNLSNISYKLKLNWLVTVEIIFEHTDSENENRELEYTVNKHTLEQVNEFISSSVLEQIDSNKEKFITTYWRLECLG